MLRPRIIPCLLVHQKGLVKTVKFKDPKYVGDPINAVKIFNEKEVDELMVIDIDATVNGVGPNFEMIKNLAVECRMPFCYGGGVTSVEHARKLISLGAEKVSLSNAAIQNPKLVREIADAVGVQSAVVVLDVKKKLFGGYEVYTHNGKKATGKNPIELAKLMEQMGAGEIVINNIDLDGVMKGFDLQLIEKVFEQVSIPVTALGGAGTYADIASLIARHRIIGVACGSIFVFKGVYKAVLINYPSKQEKKELMRIP
jgi:imidazole glycerol-phosphate synthase subunit HisF